MPIRWMDQDCTKSGDAIIMCDGSFDPVLKRAGVGVVLKSKDLIQGARAEWMENATSVLDCELRAIELGMKMARELKLAEVIFFTDSAEALWTLNVGSWRQEVDLARLKECFKELDEHPKWSLASVARDSNGAADLLARKARRDKWEWRSSLALPRELSTVICHSSGL
ncbi:hypothetical protein QQ045_003956 [Rhodiola kirilowii]